MSARLLLSQEALRLAQDVADLNHGDENEGQQQRHDGDVEHTRESTASGTVCRSQHLFLDQQCQQQCRFLETDILEERSQ